MAPENPLSHVIQHPLKEIPADLGILTPRGVITLLSDQIVMMIVAMAILWGGLALAIRNLNRTTREEPDYDKLMTYRLNILREHKLGLPDIQRVIAEMGPLPGARDFLEREAAFPAVRHVRRVDPAQAVAAQCQHFAVGEGAGRTVRQVVDRHVRGDLAAHRHRVGCCGKKVVERAALVGLDMRERDIGKRGDGQHARDGFADQRK